MREKFESKVRHCFDCGIIICLETEAGLIIGDFLFLEKVHGKCLNCGQDFFLEAYDRLKGTHIGHDY
jgi:hypothetical protein